MVIQLLVNKSETLQWLKKSNVNISQYYRLLVLRVVVIMSLLHLNSRSHFQMISASLRRGDIRSELPQDFYNCLWNIGQGSFQDKFACALLKIDDQLVIVSSGIGNPTFSSTNALLINLNTTSSREDILDILFGKNPCIPDQTVAIELERENLECLISCSAESSKDIGGIDGIRRLASSDRDCSLEDFSLQKSYEHIYETIDAFTFEYRKSGRPDRIHYEALQLEVEEFIPVLHHAMSCLNKDKQCDGDEDLVEECGSLINELKQLCYASDASNDAMIDELLDKLRERRPRMQALLTMLKGVPIPTAGNTETPAVSTTIETPIVDATTETLSIAATMATLAVASTTEAPAVASITESPVVAAASVPHHKGKKGKKQKKGKKKKGK